MNPTVPQRAIDEATERDPASASAEYLAQFRSDVEIFVSREAVEACVTPGCFERRPVYGARYSAFVDPSGGSSDSFTMAVGHREQDVAVIDALREVRPPFSPEGVVADFCALLRDYHVTRIEGDRYAGEWPREQFRRSGVTYEPSAKPKSELYVALLPALNSRLVDLLDHSRLTAQLCGPERRAARGGRDRIDHAPRGHDDVTNAVAGPDGSVAAGASVRQHPVVGRRSRRRRGPAAVLRSSRRMGAGGRADEGGPAHASGQLMMS
jgi:hypothetical protein